MPHISRKIAENLCFYIWQGKGNNCNTCIFTNVLSGGRAHVVIDPGSIVNELKKPFFDSLLMAMQGHALAVEDIGIMRV